MKKYVKITEREQILETGNSVRTVYYAKNKQQEKKQLKVSHTYSHLAPKSNQLQPRTIPDEIFKISNRVP